MTVTLQAGYREPSEYSIDTHTGCIHCGPTTVDNYTYNWVRSTPIQTVKICKKYAIATTESGSKYKLWYNRRIDFK